MFTCFAAKGMKPKGLPPKPATGQKSLPDYWMTIIKPDVVAVTIQHSIPEYKRMRLRTVTLR